MLFLFSSLGFAKTYTLAMPDYRWQLDTKPAQAINKYQPLKDYLEKQTGLKFNLVSYTDNKEAVRNLVRGKYDIAYTQVVPYLLAENMDKNVSALTTVTSYDFDSKKLTTTYTGYILALKQNQEINSVDDLKGKKMGFVHQHSLSGFVHPIAFLRSHGIDYKTFFKEYRFYNDHPAVIDAIAKKQVDAGAVMEHTWKTYAQPELFKPIAIIKDIPNPLFVASGKLTPEEKAKIKSALLSAPSAVFKDLLFKQCVEIPKSLYDTLRILPEVKNQIVPLE